MFLNQESKVKSKIFFVLILILISAPAQAQFFVDLRDSIAVGDSASAGVDLKSQRLLAILAPDTLQVDTVTFWTSQDNVTWKKVYINAGSGAVSTELKVVLVAGKYNVLTPKEAYFLRRYVKIQYGTSANGGTEATGANDRFTLIAGYY
jgi:hypothetical protein